MKATALLAIFALALSSLPRANAAVDCASILDMNGIWTSSDDTGYAPRYQVLQKGCDVRVNELSGQATGATWSFDLSDSGRRRQGIPDIIVNFNARSGADAAGIETMRSFQYAVTSAEAVSPSYLKVNLASTVRVSPQGPLRMPLRLAINGQFVAFAQIAEGGHRAIASEIALHIGRVRLTDIEGSINGGFEKRSFIAGANFLLGFLTGDRLLGGSQSGLRLKRVQQAR
jgi:hypothetical protein